MDSLSHENDLKGSLAYAILNNKEVTDENNSDNLLDIFLKYW